MKQYNKLLIKQPNSHLLLRKNNIKSHSSNKTSTSTSDKQIFYSLDLAKQKTIFNSYHENIMRKYKLDSANNEYFLPMTKNDLNNQLKDYVKVEEIDHPCFNNYEYVKRKNSIQQIALEYNIDGEIPIIDYLPSENKTWESVYKYLNPLHKTNCCKEYNDNMEIFRKEINLRDDTIPQIRDISNLLESKTGFTIAPVAGLLRPRFFLNLLAFKVFASTQFIRPFEKHEFSGEPDLLHEVLGHTVMFCDENFANFSQEIGIASLGASDADIQKLANIYWFTVEYGLVSEYCEVTKQKLKKVYGGGIVASCFEINYAISKESIAKYHDLDFDLMQTAYYDYVNLSTNYFVAESIESMKTNFHEYSKIIRNKKPWIKFDKRNNKVVIDKSLKDNEKI